MAGPSRARVVLAFVYVALIVGLLVLDVDPEQGRAWLLESGAWGLLAYVVAFTLLQPVGMASHLFVVTAALVWSPWVALMASWVGALGAGTVAFGFARYVGREWVQRRMPPKLRGWDERLAAR
ncbi:MAG: TVP38/TMEM64 family protein, partial [Myxococcales bacterium]|nr:TVP38/TMEM64 family protein [Myxococcales bacterium]